MQGSIKVTKRQWYDKHGGFSNPRCWRREENGSWAHYVMMS